MTESTPARADASLSRSRRRRDPPQPEALHDIPHAPAHDRGELTNNQASIAKMLCADRGRTICRDARDLLGGNGLILDRHVARHLTDMEVVHTYEGTDFMQSLIVGRAITGVPAFA